MQKTSYSLSRLKFCYKAKKTQTCKEVYLYFSIYHSWKSEGLITLYGEKINKNMQVFQRCYLPIFWKVLLERYCYSPSNSSWIYFKNIFYSLHFIIAFLLIFFSINIYKQSIPQSFAAKTNSYILGLTYWNYFFYISYKLEVSVGVWKKLLTKRLPFLTNDL